MPDAQPLAVIIEDDQKLTVIFAQAMRMAGFDVLSLNDGGQAMHELPALGPRLVLLDLHLPGVGGDKLLAFIRQAQGLEHVLVILATADPEMADMLQDRSDYILQKPISFGQLRDLAARIRATLP